MLESDGGTLRKVAWSEVCPWLSIVRSFSLAISFRVLLLGAAGLFLMYCGWATIGWVFSGDEEEQVAWLGPDWNCPWKAATGSQTVPVVPSSEIPGIGAGPFLGSWASLSRPLWRVFPLPPGLHSGLNVTGLACAVLCGLWSLAVWAFFGAAITRIAAVQLAADERIGLVASLRYAGRKWLAYFGAPLFPLVGCLIAAVPVVLLGLLLKVPIFVLLLAIVWPLLLLAGLILAVLLLGLAFGWPLMWGTISAEGTDSFDALSRSYAYVFQRPLRYLFYVIVAVVIGGLGWLLVGMFADGVVDLTYWAASWGCTDEQIASIKGAPGAEPLSGLSNAGAVVVRFWTDCVKLLANGFFYGFFWVAATAIYFLLRRDVDATEMDEVALDEDAGEPIEGLPPIETDEAGAPQVSDEIPEVEPDADDEGSDEGT